MARRNLLLGAVASLAGVASFPAAAIEEVVVYGSDVAAARTTDSEQRQAELKAHLEALHERLKERLDENLKNRPAASIKLALAEMPNRG